MDIKREEWLKQAFRRGQGVITLTDKMRDEDRSALLREAAVLAEGMPFKVVQTDGEPGFAMNQQEFIFHTMSEEIERQGLPRGKVLDDREPLLYPSFVRYGCDSKTLIFDDMTDMMCQGEWQTPSSQKPTRAYGSREKRR